MKEGIEGRVTESLPNDLFRVELPDGHKVVANVTGRMKKYFVRIVPGDQVRVELSPHDRSRGRIVYRET